MQKHKKIVLAKFPEIKVEDLTGTNSAWSLKLAATPLTEKAPAGGFKSGTSAIVGNTIQTPRATWGAYPGHTLDDVQSGIGIVHNALLLD
ncbi:hypothetical protein ABZ585_42055, partial [Streptomyces vietnamensis]